MPLALQSTNPTPRSSPTISRKITVCDGPAALPPGGRSRAGRRREGKRRRQRTTLRRQVPALVYPLLTKRRHGPRGRSGHPEKHTNLSPGRKGGRPFNAHVVEMEHEATKGISSHVLACFYHDVTGGIWPDRPKAARSDSTWFASSS